MAHVKGPPLSPQPRSLRGALHYCGPLPPALAASFFSFSRTEYGFHHSLTFSGMMTQFGFAFVKYISSVLGLTWSAYWWVDGRERGVRGWELCVLERGVM